MKSRFTTLAAAAATVALAGAGLVATATGAAAVAPTPGWEPDANSLGTIAFYNASGQRITGGLLSGDPLFAYASASTTRNALNTKATLYFGLPDHTKTNTLQWTAVSQSGSTTYPTTSAPAAINALTKPTVTLASGDANVTGYLQTVTLDSTANYANLIQVRLKDSGNSTANTFWQAAIEVNNTGSALGDGLAAGSWRVVGAATPTNTVPTVDTPTANPASPQYEGTSVVFSTAVHGVASGTVTFYDGATQIGAVKNVTTDGGTVESDATTTLSRAGAYTDHSITAVYVPASYLAIDGVTSSALTFRVNKPPAAATTTNLVLGAASVQQPNAVTGTATVTLTSDSSPVTAGSVTFKDGANVLATDSSSPFELSVSSSSLAVGAHTITAEFTPTDNTVYVASTSSDANLTITAPAYDASVNNVSTSIPAGTIVITTPYTGQNSLALPAMQLDANATYYSTSATFDGIQVADTRAGNGAWTLSALASNLTKNGVASPGVNEQISGENVGLTTITKTSSNVAPNTFLAGVTPGGSTTGQNLTAFDNVAASYVAANDSGSLGLGGASPHAVVHANSGLGTSVFAGTLTIKAPTNTVAGTYNGTVTFTVLGS